MLRTGGLHPRPVSRRGLDPALQRPDLSERQRAATEVAWSLLRPDFHQQVVVSFQDMLCVISLAGAMHRAHRIIPRQDFDAHPWLMGQVLAPGRPGYPLWQRPERSTVS